MGAVAFVQHFFQSPVPVSKAILTFKIFGMTASHLQVPELLSVAALKEGVAALRFL